MAAEGKHDSVGLHEQPPSARHAESKQNRTELHIPSTQPRTTQQHAQHSTTDERRLVGLPSQALGRLGLVVSSLPCSKMPSQQMSGEYVLCACDYAVGCATYISLSRRIVAFSRLRFSPHLPVRSLAPIGAGDPYWCGLPSWRKIYSILRNFKSIVV